jgi:hypothetical protein
MMLQLNPPLPLITPKGKGFAHFLIDYSQEHDLIFVCFQDDTGECWSWSSKEIRLQPNITLGRTKEKPVRARDEPRSTPAFVG